MVVHQLPVIPETLLLRLLGRGEVQRKAIEELLELPQQPLKTFVLEKLTKLKIMLKSRTRLSKEDQEIMVNIDALYEEWRNQAIEVGRQEGVEVGRQEADRMTLENMLTVKFGPIDRSLEAIIPILLKLNTIDRVRAVMQLSREKILRDFGNQA